MWRHFHIGLKGVGIGVLEVFQLGGPGDGADDVDVDAVLAPLGGGHPGKTTDALLGGGVGTLAVVAEEAVSAGADNKAVVQHVVDETIKTFGHIDALINNAQARYRSQWSRSSCRR